MPKITTPILGIYDSVTRPVCLHIANEVKRICMIDQSIPTYFPGERGVTNQPGTSGDRDEIRYGGTDKLECSIEEKIRDNQLLATPVRRENHTPVIYDPALGLTIRPVYVQHDITLNFKYVSSSYHAATRWKNEMAVRIAEARSSLQHTLLYDLTLNDEILGLLQHIWSLREHISGYKQSFPSWFQSIQVRDFYAKGAIDGDPSKLVVQVGERQAHVLGHFEQGDIPKENRNDDNVTYDIDFTYNVSYLKPVHWYLDYPLMVHQSHIGTAYFDATPTFSIDDLDESLADSAWQALQRISWSVRGKTPTPKGGLRVPGHDEWFLPHDPVNWSEPVINWMISIDPFKPQEILDLTDLPDMTFTPNMVEFFNKYPEYLTQYRESLVKFTLFNDTKPMDDSLLTIDDRLMVKLTKPLSLRDRYHLRLSIITSELALNSLALDRICEFPLAALEILQTVLPGLDVEWALRNAVQDNGYLKKDYLIWALNVMEKRNIGNKEPHKLPRKIFVNPIPEVIPVTSKRDQRYQSIGPKDPGTYSGRNEPEPTEPVHEMSVFEMDDEEELKDGLLMEPMTPTNSNELPVINNRRSMMTCQYLAIFAKRRG